MRPPLLPEVRPDEGKSSARIVQVNRKARACLPRPRRRQEARKEKPANSRGSRITSPEQFGGFLSLVRVWILRSWPSLRSLRPWR